MAEYVATTTIQAGSTRYLPGDSVPEAVVLAGDLAALGAVLVDGVRMLARCASCGDD